MTLRYADRVLEQVAAPATTGAFAISATATWQTTPAAVASYQTFANIPLIAASDTVRYVATDGANVEGGVGTWTSGSLARTSITFSSNGGSACTFSGTVTVFCDVPAEAVAPALSPAIVAAAGTTQGTATALTQEESIVTSATATQGVVLTPIPSGRMRIWPRAGSNFLLYPQVGATIEGYALNAAMTMTDGAGPTSLIYNSGSSTWLAG